MARQLWIRGSPSLRLPISGWRWTRFGPLLDPASDIVGPLGRDIPASVRDWALTSEPRPAREAGPPAWILEELRRFNDDAGC